MKKLFKRCSSLILAILIFATSVLPANALTTGVHGVISPSGDGYGRKGYCYKVGLGVCSNDTYTGSGGNTEELASWIHDYGRRFYVHAQGNPFYVQSPPNVNIGGYSSVSPEDYYNSSNQPISVCESGPVFTMIQELGDTSQESTYLVEGTNGFKYIDPEKVPELMEALKPTAPDLYTMWQSQKNATDFHPVVIVVEAVILARLPNSACELYALDCYDIYNLFPSNNSQDDLLVKDLSGISVEEQRGCPSLTGAYTLSKYGWGANKQEHLFYLFQYLYDRYPVVGGCRDGSKGSAGAIITTQSYYTGSGYNERRIDGSYIINIGPAEVGELSGNYTWHIDADRIPESASGHREDGTASHDGQAYTCTINSFDLRQANYGDWVAYFKQKSVTNVDVILKIYHTGMGGGKTSFSTKYDNVLDEHSGALSDPLAEKIVVEDMDAETFLSYLKPTPEINPFPFETKGDLSTIISGNSDDEILATSFVTTIEVIVPSYSGSIMLDNRQCHFAVYEKLPGKTYKFLQTLDDSSTQVKTSKLDDSNEDDGDPYEAMAGTPTTENLFITQGANQWVVNMQYRYSNDDYKRTYTLKSKEPVPNFLYYYAGDSGSGSFSTNIDDGETEVNADTEPESSNYAYTDHKADADMQNKQAYQDACNALVNKIESLLNCLDSNHDKEYESGATCHYDYCTTNTGTSCCNNYYDTLQDLITTIKAESAKFNPDSENSFGTEFPASTHTYTLFGEDAKDLDSDVEPKVTLEVSLTKVVVNDVVRNSTDHYTKGCTGGNCGHTSGAICNGQSSPKCSVTYTEAAHTNWTCVEGYTHTPWVSETSPGCYALPSTLPASCTAAGHVHVASCYTETTCGKTPANESHTKGSCDVEKHTHYGRSSVPSDHSPVTYDDKWGVTYKWSVNVKYNEFVQKNAEGKRGKMLSENTTLTQVYKDVKYMDIVDCHVWRLSGGIEKGLGSILANGFSDSVFEFACAQKGYTLYNAVQNNWGGFEENPVGTAKESLVWRAVESKLATDGRLANSFSSGNETGGITAAPDLTRNNKVEGFDWTPKVLSETLDDIILEYDIDGQGGRSHKSLDAYLKQALAPVFYTSNDPDTAYRNFIMVQSDFLSLEYGESEGILTLCGLHYDTEDFCSVTKDVFSQYIMTPFSTDISKYYTNDESARYRKGSNIESPQLTNPAGAPQGATLLEDLQDYAYMDGIVPLNSEDTNVNEEYRKINRVNMNGDDAGNRSNEIINTDYATSFVNILLKEQKCMPYVGLKDSSTSGTSSGHATTMNFEAQTYNPAATYVTDGYHGKTFTKWSSDSGAIASGLLTADSGVIHENVYPRSLDNEYNVSRTLPNNTYATGYAATLFDKCYDNEVSANTETEKLKANGGIPLSLYNGYIDCNISVSPYATDLLNSESKEYKGSGIAHGSGYIGSKAPVNDVVIYNPVSTETAKFTLSLSESRNDGKYVTDGVLKDVVNAKLQVIRDQRVSPYVLSDVGEDDILTAEEPKNIDLSERITLWSLRNESLYPTQYYALNDYIVDKRYSFKLERDSTYDIKDSGMYYMYYDKGISGKYQSVLQLNAGDKLLSKDSGNTIYLQSAVNNNLSLDYSKLYNAVRKYYIENPTEELQEMQEDILAELKAGYEADLAELQKIVDNYNSSVADINTRLELAKEDLLADYETLCANIQNAHDNKRTYALSIRDSSISVAESKYKTTLSTLKAERDKALNKAKNESERKNIKDKFEADKAAALVLRDEEIATANSVYATTIENIDISEESELSTANAKYTVSLNETVKYYEDEIAKLVLDPTVTSRISELTLLLNNASAPALDLVVDDYIASLNSLQLPEGATIDLGIGSTKLRAGSVVKITLPVDLPVDLPVNTVLNLPSIVIKTSSNNEVAIQPYSRIEEGYPCYYFEFSNDVTVTSITIECKNLTTFNNVAGNYITLEDVLLYHLNVNNASEEFIGSTTLNVIRNDDMTDSMYNKHILRHVPNTNEEVSRAYANYVNDMKSGDNFLYLGNASMKLKDSAKANPHKVYNSNWRYYVLGWKTTTGDTVESVNSPLLYDGTVTLVYPNRTAYTNEDTISVSDLMNNKGVLVRFNGDIYVTHEQYVNKQAADSNSDKLRYIASTGKTVSGFDLINLNSKSHTVSIHNQDSYIYPLSSDNNSRKTMEDSAVEFCFRLTNTDGILYDVSKATNAAFRIPQTDVSDSYLIELGLPYDSVKKVYKSGDDELTNNYSLDWIKTVTTVNKIPVTSGGREIYSTDFISVDDCFSLYWDNTGNIKGDGSANIGNTQPILGRGWNTDTDTSHVPNAADTFYEWYGLNKGERTDTSKWIKEKYVIFNFPVYTFKLEGYEGDKGPTVPPYYKNENGVYQASEAVYHPANTKISLGYYSDKGADDNAGGFTDYGQPGITSGSPYTYYFWCPLEAQETTNATASCHVKAINSNESDTYINHTVHNNTDGFTPFMKPTNARNKATTAIVGRIGALTIVDSGDINYSDTFKYSIDDTSKDASVFYIYPLIRKVGTYNNDSLVPVDNTFKNSNNAGKQRTIVLDPFDVRGRLASTEVLQAYEGYTTYLPSTGSNPTVQEAYNTYGTQWFKNLETSEDNSGSNKEALPLSSSINIHEALRLTQQKLGYDLYLSLESIGNYYGVSEIPYDEGTIVEVDSDGDGVVDTFEYSYANDSGDLNQQKIQVRPVYLAYNAKLTDGTVYNGPVDVYMVSKGTHVLINSSDTVNINNTLHAAYDAYYLTSIETNTGSFDNLDQNMQRRMVTDDEAKVTKAVLNNANNTVASTSLLSKQIESTELGEGSMTNTYNYGNAQYLFLRERNRNFVGGTSVAVDLPDSSEAINNNTRTQAQKWYFGLGLPASVKFVPAGMELTNANLLSDGFIISTIDVYAVGDTWTLQYKSPVSKMEFSIPNNGNTSVTMLLPTDKAKKEFQWCIPVSYYDLKQSTSRDDLDTEGSH